MATTAPAFTVWRLTHVKVQSHGSKDRMEQAFRHYVATEEIARRAAMKLIGERTEMKEMKFSTGNACWRGTFTQDGDHWYEFVQLEAVPVQTNADFF